MGKINFIWVGKLKESFSREGCAHYWKKLGRFHKLNESVIKDAPGKLPPRERNAKESSDILAKVQPNDILIVLDEYGESFTSRAFADKLRQWTEAPNQQPCFVIGGPFGMSDELKNAAHMKIRLSDMTMPHELARLVLLEQLYRACSIHNNMPYHHD